MKFKRASIENASPTEHHTCAPSFRHSSENISTGHSPPGYKGLSIDIETASNVTGLPTLLVCQMWAKAAELVSSADQLHLVVLRCHAWFPVLQTRSPTTSLILSLVNLNTTTNVLPSNNAAFVRTVWLLLRIMGC